MPARARPASRRRPAGAVRRGRQRACDARMPLGRGPCGTPAQASALRRPAISSWPAAASRCRRPGRAPRRRGRPRRARRGPCRPSRSVAPLLRPRPGRRSHLAGGQAVGRVAGRRPAHRVGQLGDRPGGQPVLVRQQVERQVRPAAPSSSRSRRVIRVSWRRSTASCLRTSTSVGGGPVGEVLRADQHHLVRHRVAGRARARPAVRAAPARTRPPAGAAAATLAGSACPSIDRERLDLHDVEPPAELEGDHVGLQVGGVPGDLQAQQRVVETGARVVLPARRGRSASGCARSGPAGCVAADVLDGRGRPPRRSAGRAGHAASAAARRSRRP